MNKKSYEVTVKGGVVVAKNIGTSTEELADKIKVYEYLSIKDYDLKNELDRIDFEENFMNSEETVFDTKEDAEWEFNKKMRDYELPKYKEKDLFLCIEVELAEYDSEKDKSVVLSRVGWKNDRYKEYIKKWHPEKYVEDKVEYVVLATITSAEAKIKEGMICLEKDGQVMKLNPTIDEHRCSFESLHMKRAYNYSKGFNSLREAKEKYLELMSSLERKIDQQEGTMSKLELNLYEMVTDEYFETCGNSFNDENYTTWNEGYDAYNSLIKFNSSSDSEF